MILRKLFKIGGTSYAITLPKDWVVYNGLKEGEFVILEVKEDIVVRPKTKSRVDYLQ